MDEQSTQSDNVAALLALLKLSGEGEQVFEARELTAVMTHELRAPIHLALGSYADELRQMVQRLPVGTQIPRSLEDLLGQARPIPELLGLVKRFAKSCCGPENGALPRELGLAIYYLTIAAGRTRCGVRLSDLSNEALAGGLSWCREQKWLDEPLRSLVNQAMTTLDRLQAEDADDS